MIMSPCRRRYYGGLCPPNPPRLAVGSSPRCSLRSQTYGSAGGAPCTPHFYCKELWGVVKSYGEWYYIFICKFLLIIVISTLLILDLIFEIFGGLFSTDLPVIFDGCFRRFFFRWMLSALLYIKKFGAIFSVDYNFSGTGPGRFFLQRR